MSIKIKNNIVSTSIRLNGKIKFLEGSSIDDIFYQLEKLI